VRFDVVTSAMAGSSESAQRVTLSDGENSYQLTFEWCEGEWRCAAVQVWSVISGGGTSAEKNIPRSWESGTQTELPLSNALLSYSPTGAPAQPSLQLSATPQQAMLAMLSCGHVAHKRRVALAAAFTLPMAQLLRQMQQLTDAGWAAELTTRRRADTLVDTLRRKAQVASASRVSRVRERG
jgi:hypothetical protein